MSDFSNLPATVDRQKLIAFLREDADGHTIFVENVFTDMGFPPEFLSPVVREHVSDFDSPKSCIFDDLGHIVPALRGVYSLDFLRFLCRSMGLDTRTQFWRRGFEARELVKRLLPALDSQNQGGLHDESQRSYPQATSSSEGHARTADRH